MAEASKDAGNRAFKVQDWPLALAHYSTAMQIDPSNHLYPLNRSLVYLKQSKWKEAEKDASKALDLQPGTAKAHFRRGLARKGAGHLTGAREDFEAAKKAGAGEEVDRELKELAGASPSPTTDKSSSANSTPLAPGPAVPSSAASSAPVKSTEARTNRLRAALATPPGPSSTSSASSSTPPATSAAPSAAAAPSPKPGSIPAPESSASTKPKSVSGLMEAVSTRRLTRAAATPSAPKQEEPAPNSFAAKKKEREVKSRAVRTSGADVSSEGGDGTHKESKESDLPPLMPVGSSSTVRSPPIKPSATSQSPSDPLSSSSAPPPPRSALSSAPTTSAAFEQAFLSSRTPEARSQLLRSLSLGDLPRLFGSSLTPDLLSEIITTLLHVSPADSTSTDLALLEWQLPFLRALTGVNRFGTVVGFMDESEKEDIRTIIKQGRDALNKLGSDWEV